MRQTVAILASILGGVMLCACGGGTTTPPAPDAGAPAFDITTAFPANDAITGWSQDTVKDSKAGPTVFATKKAVDDSDIDGDVTPFSNEGFKQLAREHYKNATYSLDLRVWQMDADAKGKTIYDSLVINEDRYKIITWTDETIGTAGRSGNSGTMWRINSYKKSFFIEALLSVSEATDTAGKDEAIKFVKFAADKIQ